MSDSVKRAIDKFSAKHAKVNSGSTKQPRKAPEKEVEKAVMQWLREQNVFAKVVDSSAVFSKAAGRYLYGQTDVGFPDVVGVTNQGVFVAIELKAPCRRSTLREHQRTFLFEVIARNAFACVTDSVSHLSALYFSWINSTDLNYRKQLLLNSLPKSKIEVEIGKPLFED